MKALWQSQVKAAPTPSSTPARRSILQRKCVCGGTPGPTGECIACCHKRKLGPSGPVLQPKLRVNRSGDRYEREADRVAEQLLRMPAPESPEQPLQNQALLGRITPLVQRQVVPEEEDNALLRRKPTSGAVPEVRAETVSEISSLRGGGGHPLSAPQQSFFESRFGYDFSQVRIHADGRAARAAKAIGARAFTVGRDVVFGSGQYAPGTVEGRRLLAHELTHVVQQQNTDTLTHGILQREPDPSDAESFVFLSSHLGGDKLTVTYREGGPPTEVELYPLQLLRNIFLDLNELSRITEDAKGKWVRFEVDVGWTFWMRYTEGRQELKLEPETRDAFADINFYIHHLGEASVSVELTDAPETFSSKGRVFLWLVSHIADITEAERTYSVDRRAIAGAIAWEALENPYPTTAGPLARFSGPGKVHYKEHRASEGEPVAKVIEQQGRLPEQTMEKRREVLATASGATTYIGAIMREFSDTASTKGGYHLDCDPAMLTTFYNAWDLDQAEALFETRQAPEALTPNDMGNWVQKNLGFLEKAVGKPPSSLCKTP